MQKSHPTEVSSSICVSWVSQVPVGDWRQALSQFIYIALCSSCEIWKHIDSLETHSREIWQHIPHINA